MASFSGISRYTGLATGLDTDELVKQMMRAERIPLDKLTQKKQLLEWKKDNYRDITNLLRGFQDDYFNVLKSSSNMISPSVYKRFTSTVTDLAGKETSLVTVTGNADAVSGSHTINVKAIATSANAKSSGPVTDPMIGTGAALTDFTGGNVSFNLTVDGVTRTISLSNRDYGSVAELIGNGTDGLNKVIANSFGANRVVVSETAPGSGILEFTANGSKVIISSAATNDALGSLKITSGTTNILNTSQSLESLQFRFAVDLNFNPSGKIKFKINSQEFEFDKSTTLDAVMNKINGSTAGVELRYSELTNKFTVTAKQTGAENQIQIENIEGNFFDAVKIAAGTISNGTNARFDLDGTVDVYRSDNTFTIGGATYTLSGQITVPATFTVGLNLDTETIFNSVKSFIDKYNELINKINDETSEPRYKDFLPLTEEQKEQMNEDEIKKWEERAKSGLLKNDPILGKIVSNLRSALFDAVEGVSGSLSDIGINTGSFENKGKLFIDEAKLRAAIKADPDKVKDLFSKTSTTDYSPDLSKEEKSLRYKEEGIAQRFYDIIRDNIRTGRDSKGYKGILIEKAGIIGDTSEFLNLMDKDILDATSKISDMNRMLQKKEESYYNKFTALEKAISRLNQQSSWLSQQFGGGQG